MITGSRHCANLLATRTVPKRALQVSMVFIAALGLHAKAQSIDNHSAKKESNMTPTFIQGPQGQLSTFRMGSGNRGLPIIFVHADRGCVAILSFQAL